MGASMMKRRMLNKKHGTPSLLSPSQTHTHLPQDAETDLAVLIQVRVKPHSPSASGHEPHTRGHEGVGWRETNNEVKESTLIRGVKGACDYHV